MTEFAIEVEGLCRSFGDFTAVDDVSFEVQKGEIFGYLGANGAGKSTTIRMLCGLLTPSAGKAIVAGCALGQSPRKLRSRIGYMSQKFSLYLDLSVEANLDFFGGAYGLYGKALSRRAGEILEMTRLTEYRRTTTADLPGGTRQRLALGTALLHSPEIVFLDEPTAGVDPRSRRGFWSLIRELSRRGTTVFVTTHYMDEAEYCGRIGLMVSGRLVALDSPGALKADWVPGRVVAVRGGEAPLITSLLIGTPGIYSVDAFGASVHVRFDEHALASAELEARLRQGFGERPLSFEPVEVSLEDVFLAVVAHGDRS